MVEMDFPYLIYKLNRGDIELTPKNRAIFEWELMKSINILIEKWDEMWFNIIHERRLEVNK